MNQTATRSRHSRETPRPTPEQRDESGSRGPGLLATLRWLGRELSGLVRRVVRRLQAPLRPLARLLVLRWVAEQLPAPLRWLGGLFAPGRDRGFGFWWLVTTLGIAAAVGTVVALLVTPVAGLIALLVVAIVALVRRRSAPGRTRGEAPAAAAAA